MTKEQKEELILLINRGIFTIENLKRINTIGHSALLEAKKIIDTIEIEPTHKEKLEFYLKHHLKYNGHNTSKFIAIKFDGEIDIDRELFIDASKIVQKTIAQRVTKINLV